ncbi:MAG: hypothetical protein JWM11_6760 [Planctomycetaceae bacterium]|nr:hypothetical protein [Planctomycetaceae bacterium]
MVKKGTKKPQKLTKPDRFPLIENALRKRTKEELIGTIMMLAKGHAVVARELEAKLDVKLPVDLLIADVSSAIDRATDFDERFLNTNFEFDWQAYEQVKKGLSQLLTLGQLEAAKSLAIKLMQDGSRQAEYSEEGLMTEDICECLKPVIRAVKAVGGIEATKWAREMQREDRGGFICDQELAKLSGKS